MRVFHKNHSTVQSCEHFHERIGGSNFTLQCSRYIHADIQGKLHNLRRADANSDTLAFLSEDFSLLVAFLLATFSWLFRGFFVAFSWPSSV